MKKLTVLLVSVCLLACGAPADSVEANATSAPSAAVVKDSTPPPPPAREKPDPEQFRKVHEYTKMFYEGQLELLHQRFTQGMGESFPLEQLSTMHEQVGQVYGKEVSVLGEETQTNEDYRGFVRWARFDKTEEVMEIQWLLNPADEIAGFYIRPAQRKLEADAPVVTP